MSETPLLTRDLATTGFSVDHAPVLTVEPGARVRFETDDSAYAEMEEVRDLALVELLVLVRVA